MPLTEKISFKTKLQKGSRLRVPTNVRWHYRLEPTQMLKITINAVDVWMTPQTFLKNINKDGRIIIPKITLDLLTQGHGANFILDVTLEPA